ncbi:hypothetical protein CROQUDRAFT_134463 [Cronartium quercuum f. sp. fusiforme G11]|uniref:Uncharacterized protein n=1 Tax=Cronartium quercuum f. sp. fusiforme G11 TaxID=708437 RepID=A0A9P6T9P4_9BASI|nr:hypothetical protein CROQUDRAFT_134463 [Cronartium quercuum f. sp. fusiforme G11]
MLRHNGKSISNHSVKIIILILFGLLNISVASLFKGEIETDSVHASELEDNAPRGIKSPRYVAKAHQLLENRGKNEWHKKVIDRGIRLKQRVASRWRARKGQKDFTVHKDLMEKRNALEKLFESTPKEQAIEKTLAEIVKYKESRGSENQKTSQQFLTRKKVQKILEEINDQTPTKLLVQLKFATITLKELEKTQSAYMSDQLASEINNAISKLDGVISSRKPSINPLPAFFNEAFDRPKALKDATLEKVVEDAFSMSQTGHSVISKSIGEKTGPGEFIARATLKKKISAMERILKKLKSFRKTKKKLTAIDEIAISMGLISIHKSLPSDEHASGITPEKLRKNRALIKRGNDICKEALVYLKKTAKDLVNLHLNDVSKRPSSSSATM